MVSKTYFDNPFDSTHYLRVPHTGRLKKDEGLNRAEAQEYIDDTWGDYTKGAILPYRTHTFKQKKNPLYINDIRLSNKTLWGQIKQILISNKIKEDEVLWVGSKNKNIVMPLAVFKKAANHKLLIYTSNTRYPPSAVPTDLVVVGRDWVIESMTGEEYWGPLEAHPQDLSTVIAEESKVASVRRHRMGFRFTRIPDTFKVADNFISIESTVRVLNTPLTATSGESPLWGIPTLAFANKNRKGVKVRAGSTEDCGPLRRNTVQDTGGGTRRRNIGKPVF